MIDTREEFEDLFFSLYLPIMIAVTAIVFGVVFFAIVRYRRREGRTPSKKSDQPLAEAAYAALLALIAAVLIAATFRGESHIQHLSDDFGLRVEVVAFKWGWRFSYPESGVSIVGTEAKVPTLVVPSGTIVRFELTSRDVIHAFWIPERRFKRDAFGRRMTEFELLFPKQGRFDGHCAEFCGLKHADMNFDVLVLSPQRFEQWLADKEQPT